MFEEVDTGRAEDQQMDFLFVVRSRRIVVVLGTLAVAVEIVAFGRIQFVVSQLGFRIDLIRWPAHS